MATLADIQSDFDWPEYLRLLGPDAGQPAPAACFKQAAEPPANRFQVGQRLESRDPRNPDNTCIASVVDRLGPRLRLRLDGSDDRNDFYRLVDSEDLFPHPSGRFIVPPLGFAKSSNYWPGFLEKVKSAGNFAPADCFERQPASPAKNYFTAGHKLEAIDRKNPLFVCPATVKEVRQDRIFVSFDGWRGAFDYWCRYDCRDIFPVGWCRRAGYPVQQPGSRAPQLPQQPQQQQQHQLHHHHHHQSSHHQRGRHKQASGGSTPSPSGTFSDKSAAPSPQLPAAAPQLLSAPQPQPPAVRVSVRARPSAASASHFDVDSLGQQLTLLVAADSNGVVSGPPGEILQALLQACLDASPVPGRVLSRSPLGDSDLAVVCRVDAGRRRLRRALPRVDTADEFWHLLGEFLRRLDSVGLFVRPEDNEIESVEEKSSTVVVVASSTTSTATAAATALAVDDDDFKPASVVTSSSPLQSPTPPQATAEAPLLKTEPSPSSQPTATTTTTTLTERERSRPTTPAVLSAAPTVVDQAQPRQRPVSLGATVGSQSAAAASASVATTSKEASSSTTTAGGASAEADEPATAAKMPRLSDPCVVSAPSSDMSEWSVADVSQFLRDSSLGALVPLFADQAIDGAALLLLNTQAMMKFMGVKLGPALKLLSCVEKAKRRLSLLHSMRSVYRHS